MGDAAETFSDPLLGVLEWEPKYAWWTQQRTLSSGLQLFVIIEPGDADRYAILSRAAELVEWAINNEGRVLADAVRAKLLDLYNEIWRDDEAPTLGIEQFISRLQWDLLQISGYEVVPLELDYEAGDMFCGHGVTLQLDSALQLRSIHLHG